MKMGITVGLAILLIIGGVAIFLSGNSEETIQKDPIVIDNHIESSGEQVEEIESTVSGEKQEEIPEMVQDNIQTSGDIQKEEVKQEIVVNSEVKTPVKQQNNTVTTSVQITPNIQKEEVVTQEEIIETVIDNTVIPSDSVGLLVIPKISVKQAVLDGHSLEVLKKGLGHFDDTAYWQGNIGILGHNSGSAGYFEKLKNLVVGDSISYTTEYGTRSYKVSSITEIADTDWSVLANTTDNRITLITCVKGVPEKRLCIQAKEIF